MEEKKLTDEEIIKALDICYIAPCCSNECPYFNKHGRNFCVEDKALYKDMKRVVQEHAEQKAEIERLKKFELYRIKAMKEDKDEIERLTADLISMDREHEGYIETIKELQKQVDELTAEKEDLYFQNQNLQTYIDNHEPIWKRNAEQAVKDTAKEILHYLIDRAYVNECIDMTVNEVKAWFREDYGVEVEE